MSKHTAGRWEVFHAGTGKNGKFEIDEYYVSIAGADMAICADIINPNTGKISEANAILISAAPDMLAALQTAEMAMLGYTARNDVLRKALKDVRAAIEKATKEPT